MCLTPCIKLTFKIMSGPLGSSYVKFDLHMDFSVLGNFDFNPIEAQAFCPYSKISGTSTEYVKNFLSGILFR